MISCYIIAEQSTVDILKPQIERHPVTTLQGYDTDVLYHLSHVLMFKPNIIFVETSFIEKSKAALLQIGKECSIIFVSNSPSLAYEAFETFAFDYLVKPLPFERFEQSINKFLQFMLFASHQSMNPKRNQPISESFFVKVDGKGVKEVLVKCKEVVYIEAFQNYVVIHLMGDKKFICHNTMKEMEESLPISHFIRIHKSFIINYEKITSIEANLIELEYNEHNKLLIGNTYRKAFFEKKSQKVIKKQKTPFFADFYSSSALFALCISLECFRFAEDFVELIGGCL
jgi:two-component system LytT family response regulator